MPITREVLDGTTHVAIDGELTIYTVADLAAALLPEMVASPRVQLNLSQVTEMDGAGVQLLAVVHREASAGGTALTLSEQSQAVRQALQLCRCLV
ncbi:STAS domain-containing protein [Pseudomonas sp. S75]|uniref:STAS domain-containing protein n=1 Tax=unclassified Pseudomonas TaxID=196821 RepID=UPI001904E4BC|nr:MULTISPECIES: STAS domain-containing protein [unclassified Pseudomonas]MBJ9975161.1 STAS domain-containing protein [Pseudomonas sp. S30]MBK0152998.1 STAS domain-containing protein [Pseudomonas sp. S75]